MDWLARQAGTRPDAIALESGDTRICYRDLAATAADGARRFAERGIGPGSTLLWEARATLPALYGLHAAWWSGATVAPFRPGAGPGTTRSLAAQARAAGVLSPDAADAFDITNFRVPVGHRPLPAPPADGGDDDNHRVLTLMQTSGSSGAARWVALRLRHHAASVAAIANRLGLSGQDRWLACLPLHHIGGLAIVLRAVFTGASVRLQERFDTERVAEALAGDAISHVSLVPTMLTRLVDRLEARREDLTAAALRCVLVGGAPADPRLLTRARALGLPVVPTWGMTEAASQLATPSPAEAGGMDFTAAAGIAGRPLDGVELRPDDGREAELQVRGPMLFEGYIGSPGGPDADGWFATGDRGFVDAAGRVRIVGRTGDRIITGGENVDALAVERALDESGLVDEVRVLGVPDEHWGERVAAVVVSNRDARTLAAWASARLEPHQRPRQWRIVEQLPRTDSGKPDREALLRLLKPDIA